MTKDDIIRMAREAGVIILDGSDTTIIERFAALVAEKEREACARICETEWSTTQEHVHGLALADMIRARGQA